MLSLRFLVGRCNARSKSSLFAFQPNRGLKGLIVGVPKEDHASGEHRVAIVPGNVIKLKKAGASVVVENDAGIMSGFSNEQVFIDKFTIIIYSYFNHSFILRLFCSQYQAAGATLSGSDEVWKSTVVAKVKPPTLEEAAKLENRAIVGIIQPRVNTVLMEQLVKQKATVLSLDSLLRTVIDTFFYKKLCDSTCCLPAIQGPSFRRSLLSSQRSWLPSGD